MMEVVIVIAVILSAVSLIGIYMSFKIEDRDLVRVFFKCAIATSAWLTLSIILDTYL